MLSERKTSPSDEKSSQKPFSAIKPINSVIKNEREELALVCAGQAAELFHIAQACLSGDDKDENAALRYLKMATECTDDLEAAARAQNLLGKCHARGWLGLVKNTDEALRLFHMAERQKLPEALYNLSEHYFFGIGVNKDEKIAIHYLHQAADAKPRGDSLSQTNLATHYLYGDTIPRDVNKAVAYFEKAIEQNESLAMNNLAWFSQYGLLGIPKNEKKAIDLYQKSYHLKNEMAAFNLGWCLENGLCGERKDNVLAFKLYEYAAIHGSYHACCHLIWRHTTQATPNDLLKTCQEILAELTPEYKLEVEAYLNGIRHEHGYCGVTKDIDKAKQFYSLGSKGSNAEACLFRLNEEITAKAQTNQNNSATPAVNQNASVSIAAITSGAVKTTFSPAQSQAVSDENDPEVQEAIKQSLGK
jgi:TPR repeat protein